MPAAAAFPQVTAVAKAMNGHRPDPLPTASRAPHITVPRRSTTVPRTTRPRPLAATR